MALAALERGAESGKFNLGTGQGHSVTQVLAAARRVTGRTIQASVMPRRPGDPPSLIADATRAARALGWKPIYALLDRQIEHAWNWRLRRTQ